MRTRFFFNAFLFITAGIFTGIYFSYALYVALFVATISMIFMLVNRPLALCTLFMALIMLVSANLYNGKKPTYKNITIEGTVETVENHDEYTFVILKNCNYKATGKNKVSCYLYSDEAKQIKEGNKITLTGNAVPIKEKKVNPGEFYIPPLAEGIDYRFYYKEYSITQKSANVKYYMKLLKEQVREIIFDNVENKDSASVLYAMVSGDKGYISGNIKEIFNACGTSHLLAVSGLHVSIFLSLFILLFDKLKVRNIISFLVIGVLVFFYSALTGFSSSVLRASVMALAVNLSTITGRRYNSVNSLGFAGTVILLLEPYRVLDISFQLSFLACFGISWIIGYSVKMRNKILNIIMDSALISLGATIFTLPLQIYYFGKFSTITLLANVLLVLVASFTIALTFIFTMFGLIWLPSGMLLHVPGHIMTVIIKITEFLSKAPSFTIRPISIMVSIVIIALMIFFTRFLHFKYKAKIAGILIIIFPLLWINTAVYHNNYAKVHTPVFDNSVCVHIEDGKNYILGLTDESQIENQVKYIKRNIGKADALILLDYEDMHLLRIAVEKGLQFDKLYGATYMKANEIARKYDMTIIAKLKTPNGYFDFQENPKFLCGDKCIEIDKICNKEYSREDIRSR